MILDAALIAGAVIAIGIGYSRGMVSSLLGILGYFGGALALLFLAINYSKEWSGKVSLALLYLGAIIIGASIGRLLMRMMGRGIHKKIFFGPLRFIDSMLGGVLLLVQYSLLSLIALTIVRYLPCGPTKEWISKSNIYRQVSEINLLSFQILDLLRSISSHLDQLKS